MFLCQVTNKKQEIKWIKTIQTFKNNKTNENDKKYNKITKTLTIRKYKLSLIQNINKTIISMIQKTLQAT